MFHQMRSLCCLSTITMIRLSRQKVSQPLRHPNSLAGRNPAVLSPPISLLCVHREWVRDSGLSCQQSQRNRTLAACLMHAGVGGGGHFQCRFSQYLTLQWDFYPSTGNKIKGLKVNGTRQTKQPAVMAPGSSLHCCLG